MADASDQGVVAAVTDVGASAGGKRKRTAEPPVLDDEPGAGGGVGAGSGAGAGAGQAGSVGSRSGADVDADGSQPPPSKQPRRKAWANGAAAAGSGGVDHVAYHTPFNVTVLGRDELMELAVNAFVSTGALAELKVSMPKLRSFLVELRRYYHPNPYHNWYHAVDICCGVLRLLNTVPGASTYPAVDRVALLTAAIAHDVDHPGLSNKVLVERQSEWAVMYNDVSPLENRSLFLAATLLRAEPHAFTGGMAPEQRRRFREVMNTVILATDVTDKDKELVVTERWRALLAAGIDHGDPGHRLLVLRALMQSADIFSIVSPFDIFSTWGSRLFHEIRAHDPTLTAAKFSGFQSVFLRSTARATWERLRDAGLTDSRWVDAIEANQARFEALPDKEQQALIQAPHNGAM